MSARLECIQFAMFVVASLIVTAVILAAIWGAKYSWSKQHQWKLAEKIPGPKGWPILGNSLSLTGSSSDTFNMCLEWLARYGTTARFWIGPKLSVFLTDPADLQLVLGNPRIRNRDYITSLAIERFFGDGLFSNRDDTWRVHRKLVTPAFHSKILESYVEIFARKADILCDKVLRLADGRTTDISHQLSLCALDAICETAIGIDMDVQRHGASEFQQAIKDALELVHNRIVHPWLLVEWLYPWTSDGRKAKKVINTIHKFSEDVIASKLASYKKGDFNKNTITTGADKRVSSFLDLLIETSAREGQSFTAVEIRSEVTTLAAAGMNTTSTTTAQVLVLLGMHPEYQDKIDEELSRIFQDDTRTATSEDLQKMKVLGYVIKETLRLFPSATLLPREIKEDLEISNGYILPAGCSAVGFSYATHRNPAYYPDPEKFWPERWTPENSVGRHKFAFLPFGAGPRNCVGHKYAMLVMKAMLSSLLRRYRFKCDCYTMKDLEQLEMTATLRSAVGYKLQIHKKN